MKANTASPSTKAAKISVKKTNAIYINGKIALMGIDEELKSSLGENASQFFASMTMVPEIVKSIE